MHVVFKSLLPRYFLKDIYVKSSQFEFQTIFSKFHYTSRRLKFLFSNISFKKYLGSKDLKPSCILGHPNAQITKEFWKLKVDWKNFL